MPRPSTTSFGVLEGGTIIEDGSREALMALGERYATLYEMQAGRYP